MKKMRLISTILFVASFIFISAFAGSVQAAPSIEGAWTVTFFIDPDGQQGPTQTICIYPDKSWDSPTYPISGKWYQKAKKFKVWGDNGAESLTVIGKINKDGQRLKQTYYTSWVVPASISGLNMSGKISAVRADVSLCNN